MSIIPLYIFAFGLLISTCSVQVRAGAADSEKVDVDSLGVDDEAGGNEYDRVARKSKFGKFLKYGIGALGLGYGANKLFGSGGSSYGSSYGYGSPSMYGNGGSAYGYGNPSMSGYPPQQQQYGQSQYYRRRR